MVINDLHAEIIKRHNTISDAAFKLSWRRKRLINAIDQYTIYKIPSEHLVTIILMLNLPAKIYRDYIKTRIDRFHLVDENERVIFIYYEFEFLIRNKHFTRNILKGIDWLLPEKMIQYALKAAACDLADSFIESAFTMQE